MEEKTCPRCGETKPIDSFHRYKNGRPKSWCKPCQIGYVAAKRATTPGWRKKTEPLARKRYAIKSKFGISLEEYERMYHAQGGVCAICGRVESKVLRGHPAMLSVDHCHQTGKVRALLCHACNVGLGLFRDSPEVLSKALEYIQHHSASRSS